VEIQERPITSTPLVTLTESAAAKIKQLMAEEPEGGLGFDRGSQEGDLELELHGVQIVVDPFSAPYLKGSEIDWVDSIQAAGFAINNPNATASCGCGHSFQVEEGAEAEGHTGGCGSGCSH